MKIKPTFFTIFVTAAFFFGCKSEKNTTNEMATPSSDGLISFEDVTKSAGLGNFHYENGAAGDKWFPEAMGAGCAFLDYDGDKWQDILLVGGSTWKPQENRPVRSLWLYRNMGDGTFELRSDEAGLGGISVYGFGITAADYDNDGDDDFFLTAIYNNMLFRNDDGHFVEVGKEAGLAEESEWSTSAIFIDANKDGWLDLYVGSYVSWSPETDLWCSLDGETKSYCTPELYTGIPSRFYLSNGNGTFTEATKASGFLPAPGKTLGEAEFDFNRDGWPDLVVANDTQRDLLYVNNGDGTFSERGALSGIAYDENGAARAGMGIDAGVVDGTGEETIFVGNFSKQMIGVYRHVSDGLFVDRAALSKIGKSSLMTLTFGLFLFDVDLDGDLDLFTANGHVQEEIAKAQDGILYEEACHLFINDGQGTFEDIGPMIGGPLQQRIVGRGTAYADFDRDGDLDILVTDNRGPVYLWRNNLSEGRHFLRVRLKGGDLNRDAIGARLVVVVGNKKIQRRMRSGSSFLSTSEKTVTFGLDSHSSADSLVIYWPDNRIDKFSDVPADQEVLVSYGENQLQALPQK